MSNDLEDVFYNNTGRLIHKWLHYFGISDGAGACQGGLAGFLP